MRRSGQTGYTLIELLLYVAVVGTLLLAVSGFLGMVTSARIKNQTINEVDQQGMMALQYIASTVRNATSITLPAAAGTGSQLTLVVPTGSLSPTIFNVSGGVLQVKEGAAAYVPLTNSNVTVSGLVFSNLSRSGTGGVVQISFTVSRNNPGNRNEFSYQQTFTTSAAVR